MTACLACTASEAPTRAQARLELGGGAIDCSQMLQAIAARRTPAEQVAAEAMADRLKTSSPHVDVPISLLVKHHAPWLGQGRPIDADAGADIDLITTLILCDRLTREVVTQRYIALHPEYRL